MGVLLVLGCSDNATGPNTGGLGGGGTTGGVTLQSAKPKAHSKAVQCLH
ncbi:MAG: hypothetical protein IPJ23_00055 [Ignavibacteriales bacterium]|nr:hypothetical protein [Ignavibacteriales bacterium]